MASQWCKVLGDKTRTNSNWIWRISSLILVVFELWNIVRAVNWLILAKKQTGITKHWTLVKSYVVLTAAIIGLIVGTVVYLRQRFVLDKTKSIHALLDDLSNESFAVKDANKKLSNQVRAMKSQVNELKPVERKMDVIAKKKGKSLEDILMLCSENKRVLQAIEKTVEGFYFQDIHKAMFLADVNKDSKIEESEYPALALRLSMLKGFVMDRDEFMGVARRCNGSLNMIYENICKEIRGENSYFNIDKESVREYMDKLETT